MPHYIYLAGPWATLPSVLLRCVNPEKIRKHTFEGHATVVFVVAFSSLCHANALREIRGACGQTRVVCSRAPIFLGLTPTGSLLWTVQLSKSETVLFSSMNCDADVGWEAARPQPAFETQHRSTFYAKLRVLRGVHKEKDVYVEMDARGELRAAAGLVGTSVGRLRLTDFEEETDDEDEVVLDEGRVRPPPLGIGDHIAYLLPMVPVETQFSFVVTKVVGFRDSASCFVKLENGHHANILAAGNVHVARFCVASQRVMFPVCSLEAFRA
jgi:hypothetical protein